MAKAKRGRTAPQKSREEIRRENRQQLQQKKNRRKTITIITLIAVGVVVAVVLCLTVFFKVSAVEVDASKSQYEAVQIRDASGIEKGDSLFLLDRAEAAERIGRQLPYTGEIIVQRSFPSKVKIYVEDGTITSAVRFHDAFIVLNESNKVVAKANNIDALNALVSAQSKKKAGTSPQKEKKATKSTTTSESTTTTSTTLATQPVTDANGQVVVTTAFADTDIAGGEDIRNADPSVTVITGFKVKEVQVGYPLKVSNAKAFDAYRQIREAMDRWNIKDITAVDLTKLSEIELMYQQRIAIRLGSVVGLDRKVAMCAQVLEEQNKISPDQKGTIDLSIEGKAYFSEGGATTRVTTEPTTTIPTITEDQTGAPSVSGRAATDVNGNPISTTAPVASVSGAVTTASAATGTTKPDLADIGG